MFYDGLYCFLLFSTILLRQCSICCDLEWNHEFSEISVGPAETCQTAKIIKNVENDPGWGSVFLGKSPVQYPCSPCRFASIEAVHVNIIWTLPVNIRYVNDECNKIIGFQCILMVSSPGKSNLPEVPRSSLKSPGAGFWDLRFWSGNWYREGKSSKSNEKS